MSLAELEEARSMVVLIVYIFKIQIHLILILMNTRRANFYILKRKYFIISICIFVIKKSKINNLGRLN
jgi:hypothetical protein